MVPLRLLNRDTLELVLGWRPRAVEREGGKEGGGGSRGKEGREEEGKRGGERRGEGRGEEWQCKGRGIFDCTHV